MTALDWLPFADGIARDLANTDHTDHPSPPDAYLLVDYPGYGNSGGSPSPQTITQAAMRALTAALPHLSKSLSLPSSSSSSSAPPLVELVLVGHSLGANSALNLGAKISEMAQVTAEQRIEMKEEKKEEARGDKVDEMKEASPPFHSDLDEDLFVSRIGGVDIKLKGLLLSAPFTNMEEITGALIGPLPLRSLFFGPPYDNQYNLNRIINARFIPSVNIPKVRPTNKN